MHLLHFGTYVQILYPYVKRSLNANKGIRNETDFIFHLLRTPDANYEVECDESPSAASRYKNGKRAVPEGIASLFCKDEARDMVVAAMNDVDVPCIDRGRKQQLIKDFINIVKQDTTIDEEFKTTVFEEASSGQLALFLADLLIYSVCVDPTERDKEYPVENYNLPMSNDWFTGRRKELEAIVNNFADGCRIQILYGMGGMGKSQIALKYAYDHYRSYSMIHWINAHTIESIVECYRFFLEEKRALPNVRTKDGICQGYTKYMDSHSDWLIIYDNCDYYTDKECSDFSNLCLPKNRSVGNILITSRNKRSVGKAKRIQVDVLPDADAVSFLLQRTESEDTVGAERLTTRLGKFPLALEIAGAYIHATPGCDFQTYMAYLGQETKILDQMVEVTEYNETIRDILLLTMSRIKKDRNDDMISRCVEDALHLFSYGAPYNIDLRVFAFLSPDEFDHFSIDGLYINKANLCAVKSVCSDALKRNELAQILIKYGLATEQPDGFLSMHELQLEILRDYIYPQNNWSFYIYVALGDFADAGNVNWLHYHQHEAYITRHLEDMARQNIASVSVVELLTLQRQEARVSLLIQEFVARLRDNPIITIAEFNEKEYSIRCAIKDMTDTYVAVEEKVAEPNLIIDFLYRLIETEVFYRSMGLYWPATIAIYFSLHALYLAFMRWGYNATIDLFRSDNNTNLRRGNLEKLLQEIRKCFPPALYNKMTDNKHLNGYLDQMREWIGIYAKAANWDEVELAEFLMIIDAYMKNDPNLLPESTIGDAKRGRPFHVEWPKG